MKVFSFSALIFLAFLFAFCTKENKQELLDAKKLTADSTTLNFGKCAVFQNQNLTICFEKVYEYRCPCDVQCVWEGAVDAQFSAKGNDLDTTFTLTYHYPDTSFIKVGDHEIRLVDVGPGVEPGNPCPDYGISEKYTAKIFVE